MMTRVQQKELLASLDELSALLRQIDWEDAEQREVASSCLSTADDVCRENLSAARAAVYHEVFDGLLTIVRKTDWIGMPQKEQEQVRQLMTEILASGISALRKEKEIKKILVFLPYKASMWDSLESVWRAAAQDEERCETYVVPIPYCDRNPDTSAAAWHCEASIFPKDVPVCDWRDFTLEKLEAIHPDVIFIHNPYDNYNLVTSVDEQYYSHNLKKCTDNLVYIPYFVTGHTIAPHFCQMPGVVNANHVIVENEDIKAAYEQNYPGGNPPKGKFLALGSPKYDAVLSHKREDYVLPEKWQKITEDRKIVLYNTSLTAMLQNSQYVCRKLRYVFSLFKDRKDIALWWRPHPLMKATIKSMRPEILAEYEAIEKEYIEEGWGIYDDTPDMDRAMVCSDCYYGDRSSMVHIYQATGKRIVLQDMSVIHDENTCGLIYAAWCDGNYLWFINQETAALLCRMNIRSCKIQVIKELPVEYKTQLECMVLGRKNNKIIIAPFLGNQGFVEYDISDGNIKIIENTKNQQKKMKRGKFVSVFEYKDSLYFIGSGNGLIIEYKGETGEYIQHSEWSEEVGRQLGMEADFYTVATFAQINNKIYVGIWKTNILIEITLPDMKTKIIPYDFDYSLGSITSSGNTIWAVPQEGNAVAAWNEEEGSKCITLPIQACEAPFHIPAAVDDGAVFIPLCLRNVIHIDNKYHVSEIAENDDWGTCITLCDKEDSVIFYRHNNKSIYFIDKKSLHMRKLTTIFSYGADEFRATNAYRINAIWTENNIVSVRDDIIFSKINQGLDFKQCAGEMIADTMI